MHPSSVLLFSTFATKCSFKLPIYKFVDELKVKVEIESKVCLEKSRHCPNPGVNQLRASSTLESSSLVIA